MNVYETLSDPVALTAFALTLLLPVLTGFLTLRRTRSGTDFILGGRRMGKVVVALSAVSSGRSSWLVLGACGMAYTRGLGAVWAIVGYTLAEFLQCLVLGRRLRAESERLGALTLLDTLDGKHPGRNHALRISGAAIIILFTTAYVAAQLNGGAKSLESALGMPFGAALLASAGLILVYMVLGGFVAVAYNDVVRASIMLLGLVVLPVWGLVVLGGVGALTSALGSLDAALLDPLSLGAGLLIGFVGIGLGSPGQPHILVRYMAIDDAAKLRAAAFIGTFWNVVLGGGAIAIGLIGRALIPDPAGLPGGDPEMIYLALASAHFGPLLFGLLVGGVFAAILSTADSQLLVVATTFVRDVYERVLRRDDSLDERTRLLASRVVVLLAGALALVLAFVAEEYVFWLVLFAWSGLGAALGPALLLSLLWKRCSRAGVLAGMWTGALVTIVWKLWLKDATGLYELVPAFFGAGLAVVAASVTWPDRASDTPPDDHPAPR